MASRKTDIHATSKAARVRRIAIGIVVVLALAIAAFAWYVNDYYHADGDALAVMADEDGDADGVVVETLSDGAVAFVPDDPTAGLVFYPGAKVQPEAYAPLLEQCAERGILCVLVKPLFNLAILDVDAAEGVAGRFPGVDSWLIGGHSMGGVAASDYLSRHQDDFEGLALLASYPSVDLSGFDGKAMSIVGTNDQVVNRDNLSNAQDKLPNGTRDESIEGGNHANYGNYGDQGGDGAASISRDQQQRQTADAIAKLAA